MLLVIKNQMTLILGLIQPNKWIEAKPVTVYELLSLLLAILGFFAVVLSIRKLSQQTKLLVQNVKCDTYASITSNLALSKQVFIEHPKLRPYFYSGVDITDTDNNYNEVVAIAEHLLDFFDGVLLHEESQLWPEHLWTNYIKHCFKCSPILCRYLQQSRAWYTERLFNLMEIALSE